LFLKYPFVILIFVCLLSASLAAQDSNGPCPDEPLLSGGYAKALDWGFDVANGFSKVIRHSESGNDHHFWGLIISEKDDFPAETWWLTEIAKWSPTGLHFRTTSDASVSAFSKENERISASNSEIKQRIEQGKRPKDQLNLVLLYGIKDAQRDAIYSQIEKTFRGNAPKAKADKFSIGKGCLIDRFRTGYEVEFSVAQVSRSIPHRDQLACAASAVLAHLGFSNVLKIFESEDLIFKSDPPKSRQVLNFVGAGLPVAALYRHGLPIGSQKCELVEKFLRHARNKGQKH
jgi:hypothetical protein